MAKTVALTVYLFCQTQTLRPRQWACCKEKGMRTSSRALQGSKDRWPVPQAADQHRGTDHRDPKGLVQTSERSFIQVDSPT